MKLSIPYLQMKRRCSYDEAKRIYDDWQKKAEKVMLRTFQKGMICPECLKVYSKMQTICERCPDEAVRVENAKIDRRLKRLGLIR